jgi:uncharacterized NAD(P)/FAD-binding protein YdhS
MTRSVAIIGAGFSGTLTALHLLSQRDGPRVALIERGAGFGPGLAYGAGQGEHLLNVRAGNMSAFPDRPSHLLDWLVDQGLDADPASFVRRSDYGRYIQALVRAAVTGRPPPAGSTWCATRPWPSGARARDSKSIWAWADPCEATPPCWRWAPGRRAGRAS